MPKKAESDWETKGEPLFRPSIAERAARALRSRIIDGLYLPGAALSEKNLTVELGVSRNTLREAFRLLTHERLLDHEPYQGVSVRRPSAADVSDIYRVRLIVECTALRSAPSRAHGINEIARAVEAGEEAEKESDWRELGTANMHFHQAIAALANSHRVNELMRGILAELRLVFNGISGPQGLHLPYLARNREILTVIQSGDNEAAADRLADYLAGSERQLLDAYQTGSTGGTRFR